MQFKPLIATAALVLAFTSGATRAQGWTFEFEPYALAVNIEGDAGIGRAVGTPVDVDFSAILENLEMAFMGHFEAHHESGWGLALDYGFMDLGADISGSRGGVLDAGVKQGMFEGLLLRRIERGESRIDYLIGVRWWDNEIDVTIDPGVLPGTVSTEIDEDWIDLIIGLRWSNPISDRWRFVARGDVGGLGLESDFTAGIALGALFEINDLLDLDFQYKATWVDYESGSPGQTGFFSYDTVTHGPLVGLNFKF